MSRNQRETLSAAKLALKIKRLRAEQPDSEILQSEPIAVVGIGCRLPGGAQSASQYWQLLLRGGDVITEIPAERWDADRYYSPDLQSEGKMNTRWGGFLENFDQFDPLFFGISPREAAAMDPQHRLLLEVAWGTLWDAGIAPDKMQGSSTGVFLGVAGTDYARLLLDDARSIGPHTCAGVAHSMASGRISFLLDLHGPSITIDTACSSSLVAVHLACQSLRAGSCRTAMAGGVSLKFRPEHYLCLSKLGMMSPTGKCQTFDASGDGFVPGEGCGMVLLKPLTDALVERCRIYAVIRGSAANQDGRTNSLTAPSGLAQQAVIRSALTNGRVAPADISYVETHGTGTALGDPIEVEALSETIGSKSVSVEPCALGAVKTNIGHLESASGIAGLIKAVLALHHKEIPSNLHYHRLNSHLALEGTRFFLPLQTAPWPRSASPRFAAVSSFGFSGTNAHIVLEEAPGLPAAPQPAEPVEMHSFVLPISARTSQACDAMAGSIRDFLDGDGLAVPLYNICHSAANRRSHYEERLALTAESPSSLRTLLDDYLSGRAVPGVSRGRTALDNQQVVFVFSGQGSQWPRMGLELYSHFPAFRAALDACDAEIQRFAGWSVIETISSAASELDRTAYAQPAIFAVELSLAKLWQSWGIMPTSVLGHSVGEIAAAHIAGALSLESAARMVVMRGRLMEVAAGRGKMAVLYQRSSEVAGEILPFGEAISIACVNSPFSTVISGESSAVDALLARQHARGIASRAVRVEYAFHSAQMQSCSEAFAREIGPIARETLQIPMISTVTGTRIRAADLDGSYWARNIRQPVLFADAVHAAAELGGQIFLEVGPHPVLLGSIAECAESRFSPSSVLPSTKRGANESQSMLTSLGKLYVAGCSIAWDRVYPDHVPAVELPVYPYQRERIWLEERPKHAPLPATRPLAMRQIRSPQLAKEVFETRIGIESMPWLADHRIAGTLLLPMTAFIEIARRALEAAGRAPAALSDFAIIKPLVVPEQQERTVQVIFEHDLFQIFSLYGDTWTLHATGRSNTAQGETSRRVKDPEGRSLSTTEHYESLTKCGAEFGPAFRTIQEIRAGEGWARTRVRIGDGEIGSASDYLAHPALLDGCLQTVIPALPRRQREVLYVPFGFSALALFGEMDGEVSACATIREGSTIDSVLADVEIWRGEGLEARISGLRMNRLQQTGPDAQPNNKIYEVRWQVKERGAPVRPVSKTWTILSDDTAAGQQIAESLAQLGCTAVVCSPETALEDPRDFRGVLLLCEPECASTPDAAIEACNGVLTVVLEILKKNPENPPQLWFVTRGAAQVSIDCALTQSAILGMARTVAVEHPELVCGRIDVDATAASWARAAEEIVQSDGEDEVAYRNDRRYVPRLQHASTAATETRRWKVDPYGSIDNLATEPVIRTAPAPGEVEVEVEASALNFRDVLTVLGMYPGTPALGIEFCGRVVRTGSGVTNDQHGDRVCGIAWGSLCGFVSTPAALTFPVPEALSSVDAVTVPNAFLTARYCLAEIAKLQKGHSVLIHAATGGVGLAAVQLARLAGAEVFATAGSSEKRDYLRNLGISNVFDSRSLGFAAEVAAATGGEGVDVVLNSLSGEFIDAGFSVLRKGGCFIEIGKNGIWTDEQVRSHRPDCRYFIVDLARVIDDDPGTVQRHLVEIHRLLERGSIQPLPAHIYDFQDAPQAFRLMSQARHIGKVVLRHTTSLLIRPDRTYLITGGLGAIGLSAAEWLARRGARHLVLLGRQAPSDPAREAIHSIEEAGTKVITRSVDVSSREQLQSVFNEIGRDMPPLGGVIHAAGVIDDGMIEQQTLERLRRVMTPKIAGAWNLHELTRHAPLDFFLLFSSLAAVTGSPSQAGYSAANAWMDALALERRRQGLAALSVNWGAWSGGGMASDVARAGKRRSLPGLDSMTAEQCWQCLEKSALPRQSQMVIADADWSQWAPMPSILSELTQGSPARAQTQLSVVSLKRQLENTPIQNRRAVLLEYLRNQTRQILGLSPSHFIDEREPLVRMGLDSLMAVELRNQLAAALDRRLMATLLFDHPSLSDLASFLLGTEKAGVIQHDALLEELHSISDAEAEELLRHELEKP